ncbi:hypothetical protein EJ08DRAFT_375736 [Tothia fuscella]|uniref:Uncharacterized protein n=1 Tax=Tothia fuscella TaxID=1048955 RepID=A0A9P4TWF3_9PEZI|nr:hypothetical protein EJ08DRAFT_375736 [Tothia fuscella]
MLPNVEEMESQRPDHSYAQLFQPYDHERRDGRALDIQFDDFDVDLQHVSGDSKVLHVQLKEVEMESHHGFAQQIPDQRQKSDSLLKTDDTAIRPRMVVKNRWAMIVYIILSAIPLGFLWLVSEVVRHNRQRVVSETFRVFENVTRVVATVFPITFAAIARHAITQLARLRLEKGISLGAIEQLMRSRTVFATVHTQVALRSANILGLSLVLFWLLSPLGGQSFLRMMPRALERQRTMTAVQYYDTRGQPMSRFWPSFHVNDSIMGISGWSNSILHAMYSATLLSSDEQKLSSTDLWGNAKIPYLTSTNVQESMDYSSLIGIPIVGAPRGNGSVLVESNYINLECTNLTKASDITNLNNIASLANESATCLIGCGTDPNTTFLGWNGLFDKSAFWSLGIDNFVDRHWWYNTDDFEQYPQSTYPEYLINEPGLDALQATLLFQSVDPSGYTSAYCKISEIYVESRVNWTISPLLRSFSVVSQKPSRKPHVSRNITHLSWPTNFGAMNQWLPRAVPQIEIRKSLDMALYYIYNMSIESAAV